MVYYGSLSEHEGEWSRERDGMEESSRSSLHGVGCAYKLEGRILIPRAWYVRSFGVLRVKGASELERSDTIEENESQNISTKSWLTIRGCFRSSHS